MSTHVLRYQHMHKHTQWMETQTHVLYYNKYVYGGCMYGSITTVVHTRYASISKENPLCYGSFIDLSHDLL